MFGFLISLLRLYVRNDYLATFTHDFYYKLQSNHFGRITGKVDMHRIQLQQPKQFDMYGFEFVIILLLQIPILLQHLHQA